MYIEIRGAGNHNKGAEMMLLTILENISIPDAVFVYQPSSEKGQYEFYSKLGLHPKFALSFKGISLDSILRLVPKRIRRKYGLVLDIEIDVVLDASGFAYSDQWGEWPAIQGAKMATRRKKEAGVWIMMPQAFGPFSSRRIRSAMNELIQHSDLVFARDAKSLKFVSDFESHSNVLQAPDFTCLLGSAVPKGFDASRHQACVVPNARMLDKLDAGEAYFDIVAHAITYFDELGICPFLLVHGGQEDLQLAKDINRRLQTEIPIVVEGDPRVIKGILKTSEVVFGSRYHALVSALSAGVITFGVGWSHKYVELFEDYDFSEGLLSVNSTYDDITRCMSLLADPAATAQAKANIAKSRLAQIEKAELMFHKVNSLINAL